MGEIERAPERRSAVALALVLIGCFAGAVVSAYLRFPALGTAIVFLPYAVLTIALVLQPPRVWWLLLLASAAGNLLPHLSTGASVSFVLGTEVANFSRAVIVALALRRFGEPLQPFDTLRGTIAFLVAAVGVAPAVAAVFGALDVVLHTHAAFVPVWWAWFLSNALTAVTVLPIGWVLATRSARMTLVRGQGVEAAALGLSLVAVSALAFLGASQRSVFVNGSMYWPIPFLLWAAVRFGPTGLSAALVPVSTFAIYGAMALRGPFSANTPAENLLALQLFLIVTSIPLFLLSTILTQYRRTEAALLAMRDDERRKEEFLAILGHELRSPLAPITTALDVLGSKNERSRKSARQLLGRQVRQMRRLVDDLLDWTRSARGELKLNVESCSAVAIVDQAVETVRPMIEGRNQWLSVTLPPEEVLVRADHQRMTQVLVNLLSNATKYSKAKTRIALTMVVDGTSAVISVSDEGVGIPAEMRERIFEMFNRGAVETKRSADGLGVGLTVAQRVVHLHGGTIEVRANESGVGTEFVVSIPLAFRVPVDFASRLDVLVVDDNVDSADSLAQLLSLWGHEVRKAYDGESALAAAQTRRPDVVVSDVMLPGINGLELARLLRGERSASEPILIAVTGFPSDYDRDRSLAAGFDEHLMKPIDNAELAALLARACRAPS